MDRSVIRRFGLYYHTIRYLKWKQIRFQVYYKIRRKLRACIGYSYRLNIFAAAYPLNLKLFIPKYATLTSGDYFTFLNRSSIFQSWNDMQYGKLWNYNLNYMDCLNQAGMSFEEGKKWVNRFVEETHDNRSGMEPYPVALRGINWIKFISANQIRTDEREKNEWDSSLYAQYCILEDNIEYHLLGNHLLEDACSLLWGGLYFREERWYRMSEHILYAELNEQILPDGAHFELSPMYHAILLDRLLDCINASKNNLRYNKQGELICFMEQKVIDMLGWLEAIIYKDGSIPLVNDSANGIAPSPADLFEYARRLGLKWRKKDLKESGYRKFESSQFEFLFDTGKIGADYIPGHAHADTFNFELRIKGKPFITDTGTSTYGKNERRQYERSTKAHNTVIVDSNNSSQIWDAFRVGKRAYVKLHRDEKGHCIASHNGFGKTVHERTFSCNRESVFIKDRLISSANIKGQGFIILNPMVEIILLTANCVHTNNGSIFFKNVLNLWIEDCEVAFEFNRLSSTQKICYSFIDNASFRIDE